MEALAYMCLGGLAVGASIYFRGLVLPSTVVTESKIRGPSETSTEPKRCWPEVVGKHPDEAMIIIKKDFNGNVFLLGPGTAFGGAYTEDRVVVFYRGEGADARVTRTPTIG